MAVSKYFIPKTYLKIQFWLLGAILGSKFAKIRDYENVFLDIFEFTVLYRDKVV